ncbi:DUF6473 family protein [Gymnodinialimonas ceratoperidinii]|uniref:DUF6473 domain-containing protein n=1 Tax=Gymnodinialimonas ceratoperidinii TaxID=2856823 RepID=A0A8F6TXU8_9RHOB|nr:DUF6473 family protein [Gymnodinialimonas ceratoperidinii]QXT39691.1 hypothetical protein KYE46_00055 [Gymnodinialimonas ceratoperidinii]
MSFELRGRMPLDYQPSALPGSALRFRGPIKADQGPAVVCLGSSETFGRFIDAPFATQLDEALDLPVLNLGVINAGLDVMTTDPAIASAVAEAEAVVMQITSAHNITNRFYSVHPRRNDRFLSASAMLRTIYPQVDFTEFHFTRHLLNHLRKVSEDRFQIVRTELETAWVARMRRYLSSLAVPVHLLWLSHRLPTTPVELTSAHNPLFVTGDMLAAVAQDAASVTIAAPEEGVDAEGVAGKFYGPREEAAARLLPGPELHARAAELLLRELAP